MRLTVKFKIIGQDHSGYCSDEEAAGNCSWDDFLGYYPTELETNLTDDDLDPNGFLKKSRYDSLTFYQDGCSSKGSKSCHGFHQHYKVVWARKTEFNKEDIKEDTKDTRETMIKNLDALQAKINEEFAIMKETLIKFKYVQRDPYALYIKKIEETYKDETMDTL